MRKIHENAGANIVITNLYTDLGLSATEDFPILSTSLSKGSWGVNLERFITKHD